MDQVTTYKEKQAVKLAGFNGAPLLKEWLDNNELRHSFTKGRFLRRELLAPANIYLEDWNLTPSEENAKKIEVVFWFKSDKKAGYYVAELDISNLLNFAESFNRYDVGFDRVVDRETGESEFVKTGEITPQEYLETHLNSIDVATFISWHYQNRYLPNLLAWS